MIQGAAFRVLACFYAQDVQTFTDLCNQAGYPTDLGGYYIRQLLKGGFLQKEDRGQYRILPKGKRELALHYGKRLSASYPRVAVLLLARQDDKYVVLRRTVQPFLGVAEWPAGMVEHGEEIADAATRVLKARLGVEAPAKMVGFFRRIDMYGDAVFDDKLFAVHTIQIPAGVNMLESSSTGTNELHAEAEMPNLERPSQALLDIFEYTQSSGREPLQERRYKLSAADLAIPE